MSLENAGHQESERTGRTVRRGGEAELGTGRDEAGSARRDRGGSGRGDLLGQALARENLARAWQRVKANRGSAGVDGLSIDDTAEYLKTHWPQIRTDLLTGRYRPQPVRRVQLPKSGGGIVSFKQRIRQLTRRNGGRSLAQVVIDLRRYVLGWKAYFQLAQTPTVLRGLDKWLRHRLRAIQLKHWRWGTTVHRSLRVLGATSDQAAQIASGTRSWWRNSAHGLHRILTIAYFDRLGVPRLS